LTDNEYVRNRVARNPMLMVLYTIVLPECINRINFFEKSKIADKVKPILYEARESLSKTILLQAELLSVKGKLELAKHKLELAEKTLRTFSELERQKKKYVLTTFLVSLSIFILHYLSTFNILIISEFLRSYGLPLEAIITYTTFENALNVLTNGKVKGILNIIWRILNKFIK